MMMWYWPQQHFASFAAAADPPQQILVRSHNPGQDAIGVTLEELWNTKVVQDKMEQPYDVLVLQEDREASYLDRDAF